VVFETENYDNNERMFKGVNKNGNEVSTGTYFYKIEFTGGKKTQTGYLSLKGCISNCREKKKKCLNSPRV